MSLPSNGLEGCKGFGEWGNMIYVLLCVVKTKALFEFYCSFKVLAKMLKTVLDGTTFG